LKAEAYNKLQDAKTQKLKQDRAEKVRELKKSLVEKYFPAGVETTSEGLTKAQFSEAFHDLEERVVRDQILAGRRIDGRAPSDLRAVSSRVGLLPRVHGSALFTRGETQSLATATLGTTRDQQKFDGLFGEDAQRFMLHYYFPPFSVGECKPIRGPGRREIGHGCLAERSVLPVIPPPEKFPYTIRIISDILESNGSSSMASVCSATLALMDSGVPILQPVAGISIGLVDEGTKYTLLTDIMAGHVPAGCGGLTSFLQHHRSGKVNILAVSSPKRSGAAPDLPTVADLGYPKLASEGFYAFYAPARTPAAMIEMLNREIRAVIEAPEMRQKLLGLGLEAQTSTPAELRDYQNKASVSFTASMKAAGIVPE
jgi:ribonuclease PH